MPNRLLLLAPLLALGAAAGSQPTSQPSTRPTVFRCVLDGNARMIVVSLGDDVYAAYDANRCTLAKLWRGRVILTGPVYDDRHGRQPQSSGVQLLARPIDLAPRPAPAATRPTDYANVNGYRGYSIRDGVPTIHFDFDGVTVDESLTLVSDAPTTPSTTEPTATITVRRTLTVGGNASKGRPYVVRLTPQPRLRRARMSTPSAPAGQPPASPMSLNVDTLDQISFGIVNPPTVTFDMTFAAE